MLFHGNIMYLFHVCEIKKFSSINGNEQKLLHRAAGKLLTVIEQGT